MGGAFVAAGEGVSAIPYNPAGVSFIKKSEGYYSKTNYVAGITHNVMSYGMKLSGSDFFGVHLFYLDSGLMEENSDQSHFELFSALQRHHVPYRSILLVYNFGGTHHRQYRQVR